MAVRRRESHRLVTGDDELDAVLQMFKVGFANRIVRPALRKGVRHLRKRIRGNLPQKYRHLTHLFGWRVDNKGGPKRKDPQAKAGAAVGRSFYAQPKRSGRNRGGVGITSRNIHWLILGSKDRYQWRTTGKWTGKMPQLLFNLIPSTTAAEEGHVKEMIRRDVMQRIEDMVKNGKINRQFETT